MTDDTLQAAKEFYQDRILGWMINDLKKSITAGTNFLTALGCLVYTEVIGAFLPPLPDETGKPEERRFYRCFFRLKSATYLQGLDNAIRKETDGKGLYGHLRHNMTHRYVPVIVKNKEGTVLVTQSIVAIDGYSIDKVTGLSQKSPPIFLSDDGKIGFATKNYTEELENAVNHFINKTFEENEACFQTAAVKGLAYIAGNRHLG